MAALGAAVLVGWIIDNRALTAVGQTTTMKPVTALCLILLGSAVISASIDRFRHLANFAALSAGLVGLVTLFEHILSRTLIVDHLPWSALTPGPGQAGRMAAAAAICAISTGTAAAGRLRQRPWSPQLVTIVLMPSLIVAAVSALGFLYGAPSLHNVGPFSSIALHTAIGFIILDIGIFNLIRAQPLIARGQRITPGTALCRRLLPITVIGIPLLGWLRLLGQRQGWYGTNFGLAIMVIIATTTITAAVLWAARLIDHTDSQRLAAFEALRNANETLEQRVVERTQSLDHLNNELVVSENRFRSLIESSPLGMYRIDRRGVIAFVNQPWADIYRTTISEAIGQLVPPNIHPEHTAGFTPRLQAALALADTATDEFRLLLPDGTTPHIRAHVATVRDGDGDITGWVGTVEDITSLYRQQRRDAIVHSISFEVHQDLDPDAILQRAAATIGAELGVTRAGLQLIDPIANATGVGRWSAPGVPALSDDDTTHALGLAARAIEQRRPLKYRDAADSPEITDEARAACRRIGLRAVLLSPIIVNNEVIALLGLSRDTPHDWDDDDQTIVDAVSAEIATSLLHARLYQQQRDLSEQLASVDRDKTEFISNVTHELRTPLTSISGYLDLLLDGDVGDIEATQTRMLHTIKRNTERLNGFVTDLLTIAKLDGTPPTTRRERVDVASIIANVVLSAAPEIDQRAIHLTTHSDTPSPVIDGDPNEIEQIVQNLINNAIKFTPDHGNISIFTTQGEGRVRLEVTDDGIGIPVAEQPQLFTRFYRSSNAQSAAIHGTGLGLAIVRRLVERHQGAIDVQSAEGHGTAIRVDLPAAAQPTTELMTR